MFVDGRPETIDALFAFLVAAVIAWLLVPLAERIAWRIGAIDYPNERSLHADPTPKLGGLAILVAVARRGDPLPALGTSRRGRILVGAVVIVVVGVLDDVFDLPAAAEARRADGGGR